MTKERIAPPEHAEALLRAQLELGISLSATSDLPTALQKLLSTLLQLECIDAGLVYLVDGRTGDFHLEAHRGKLSAAFIEHIRLHPASAQRAQLLRQGQPVYELYDRLEVWRDPGRDAEGLRALAILPIRHESEVIGAFLLASHEHETIPAQSRVAMETIATQAAGAIARIRAENALRDYRQRLQAIIASVPVILFAVDREGVITFEEGQALGALGLKAGQDVGRRLDELYPQYPILLQHMRRALRGEQFNALVEMGPVIFDCWYSPTRDERGEIIGYLGVAVNITERQRLERQILSISDREQARLGQEIHDGLCQQLVSLAFDANLLERELATAARPEAAALARFVRLLDATLTEARQLSRGLFPVHLDGAGLASSLQELAHAVQQHSGIECVFEGDQAIAATDSATATHLYRIAQEAVNNALKHARASSITIRLQSDAEEMSLDITDDGAGLGEPAKRNPVGMGLHIMEYRARIIGGRLTIQPGAGTGTRVCCHVPWTERTRNRSQAPAAL